MDHILRLSALLLLSPVYTAEPPQSVLKTIQACPSVGYFFEQQGAEATCYLCYCKGVTEAVCILRDKDRCTEENHSSYNDIENTTMRQHRRRKHRRSRRSAGLMDMFFKSKTEKKELMTSMIQGGEQCEPKASKSIGCPPKDWCQGCLVCDCDNDNQWQCHVMSFCDDKSPKQKKAKSKTSNDIDILNLEYNEKNETSTTTVTLPPPIKRNNKRSIKPKQLRRKSTTTSSLLEPSTTKPSTMEPSTRKPTTKPSTKNPMTKPSTTRATKTPTKRRNKPTKKTPKPLISVETKKAFKRKGDKGNKDVVVIKKFISTLAPITSPELLKYRNDPNKLAQILYQMHEANLQANKNVKREIRSEAKVGGMILLTHEFTKKNKATHDTANSKNMGDKILSMKHKSTFKLNNNARGRKPMNIKEHNDRNTKMKAKRDGREKKGGNSFYLKQKELMEPYDGNNISESSHSNGKSKDTKGNYERKETIKFLGKSRRLKRHVALAKESTSNSTNMENEIVNTSLVNSDPVSEIPENLFTNNEEITSNSSKYVYTVTVDDKVTANYDSNVIIKNDTTYETGTTSSNVAIITISDSDFGRDLFSFTDMVNYTTIEDESTTENRSVLNYLSQKFNVSNYNVSEPLSQDEHRPLQNIFSLESTSIAEPKESFATETTTLMETTEIQLLKNETKKYNITNAQKKQTKISEKTNNTTNIIKKGYVQDIDRIFTDLNKCKRRKLITNTNSKTNNSLAGFNTILQSLTNITKYRSKQNRMMAIKYLKKLYSKLLSKKNNKTLLTNVAVMESICDTFGPCKINTASVEIINCKINELIIETRRALNIISKIKELLESVGNDSKITDSTTDEGEFKGYVKKLNAVLTDNYTVPSNDTQMSKMKIIKGHTKDFIDSIGKFAFILNDILKIIRSDKSKYDVMRRGKILLNRTNRKKSEGEPLHKIKRLFMKYDMLQNSFMRNMYQAIKDLEIENNIKATAVDQNSNNPRDRRYKMSVDKYMNKISYNLEKLKELALKKRVKRHAMRDEDAVEYLLTLMEYLLKKNNPLNSPPVTDGIDLLIDAIRRAPEIRPIKKNPEVRPIKKKIQQHSTTTTATYFMKELPKSSVESNEENISFHKNRTDNFRTMNFERPDFNETQILQTNTDSPIEETATSTTKPLFATVTTTKYVDVEDLVFNGDQIQKVYIATFSPEDTSEEPSFLKETPKPIKKKKLKVVQQYTPPSDVNEEKNLVLSSTTHAETQTYKEISSPTAKPKVKTQFDLLNEEYENELKIKSNAAKPVQLKRKKQKRLKNKQKLSNKTDVSSITKEVDEERYRKKVAAEEATLRKHMLNSINDDPFKSIGEESVSGDLSPLDGGVNEPFPSFFT